MNRRKRLAAALVTVTGVVGSGLAYASTVKANGYACPITGEELPCEKCCPLNAENGQAVTNQVKAAGPKGSTEAEYICPITGEKLGCPNCCPLNEAKK